MHLFILLLVNTSLVFIECCPIECLCNGTVVDCSYLGLENIHLRNIFDHLPKSTTALNIGYNNIDNFEAKKSMIFSDMRELNLTSNQFKSIPSNVLDIFPFLQKIDFSKNRIGEVKRNDFNDLINLTEISLDSNQLSKIEKGAFNSLDNLRFLKLSNNHIENISKSLFSTLKNLEILDLTKNLISTLTDNLFNFEHSSNLAILLSHNKIRYIPNGIFKKDTYSAIDLSNNDIKLVGDKAFENMTMTSGLFLNNNSIKTLPKSSMENIATRSLTLINNPLICSCNLQKVLKGVLMSSKIFEFLNGECIPYKSTKVVSVIVIVSTWSDICEKCQHHDTCQNNSTCHPYNATTFKCQCNEKFIGEICSKEKTCYPGKCLNNGICSSLNNTDFICKCDEHYIGKRCEFSNPCTRKPCQNNGYCITEYQSKTPTYKCICRHSYVGKNCDTLSSSRKARLLLLSLGWSIIVCIVLIILFVKLCRRQRERSGASIYLLQ